jgi:DNA-binding MarR family transcriptional regulator
VRILLIAMSDESLLLDHQLCFPLYAAARAMMQAYQPLLDRLGLTYPQYVVLLVLWETDGLSVKQLGERLYLDSGTLTPLLKRIESAGLVTRTRSSRDERVVEIRLTPLGKKLKQKARAVPSALACRLELSPEDLARLRRDLMNLFVRLRRAAEANADPHTKDTKAGK